MAGLILASLAVGVLLGSAQASMVQACSAAIDGESERTLEIRLLEDSADYGYAETALVEAQAANGDFVTFKARLAGSGPAYVGQRFRARAAFERIDYGVDPYAWQEGACATMLASDLEEAPVEFPMNLLIQARVKVIEHIGSQDDGHALMQALVCGYRRTIKNTELYTWFQECGLAHLVAVSGAHLVIVTGLFASILKLMRVPRRASVGVLVGAMATYYVIAGMPVSALRAVIMASLGLFSFFGRRRASSLNAIGIGLFAIVTSSPHASVSASLTLSALSTVGIVLFAPLVQSWLMKIPVALPRWVLDALSLTMASSTLSQLYACSLFDQLPIIAPVANVLCAPLFPLACGSGLVAGVFGTALGVSDGAVETIAECLSGALAFIAQAMSQLPLSCIPFTLDTAVALVASAVCAFVLWLSWPQPKASSVFGLAAVAVFAACIFVASADQSDRIVMFDIGQGDSIYIQSEGHTLLIDTGNKDSKLLHELASNRISHIDSVLITHSDDDHCGSLDLLGHTVAVDRVLLASGMLTCEGRAASELVSCSRSVAGEVIELETRDSFSVGAFAVRAIWPFQLRSDGGNADSLCVLLEYDGDHDGVVDFTALMTGDAEKQELASMIEAGLVGDIDILKVGHHGSKNGMTREEVDVLKPEIALVSCGVNNRYGHPAPEIIEMLEEANAACFRTDLLGEVTCVLEPGSIHVRCAKS